jgi:hypothetical protein
VPGGEVNAQQPDRPTAEHQNPGVRPEVRRRQRRHAHGQRLDKRRQVVAEPVGNLEQCIPGNGHTVGEHAGPVEAQQLAVLAQVLAPCEAVPALPADAQRKDRPAAGQTGNSAHHLVTENQRGPTGAMMALEGMQVRPADAGQPNVEHHLTGGRLGVWLLLHRQLAAAVPDERSHSWDLGIDLAPTSVRA